MTDHKTDGEIKNQAAEDHAPHDDAPSVPESVSIIPHDAAATDAPKADAHAGGAKQPSKEITLQRLTPHNSWEDYAFRDETIIDQAANAAAPQASQRRMSVAAIVALAAFVGAIGGSLATAGVGQYIKNDRESAAAASASAAAVAEQARSFESAIGKINAEIAAIRSGSASQSAKISERIEKIEKAQAEPAAKLAKLSEAVDKLRAPATPATSAPETTGSIKPVAAQPNRLPIVEGWRLHNVYDGAATVGGRAGIFEVIPGDPLPGVGRVDAIRRQDGRWVVVTSRGLIVSR